MVAAIGECAADAWAASAVRVVKDSFEVCLLPHVSPCCSAAESVGAGGQQQASQAAGGSSRRLVCTRHTGVGTYTAD